MCNSSSLLIIDWTRGYRKDNQQLYPLNWDLQSTQSSFKHFKKNTQEQNVHTQSSYNRERGETQFGQNKVDSITLKRARNTKNIISKLSYKP